MADYIPIGAGYTPISGQAFRSPKKKFPHLKGIERERALYEQEQNPRVDTQGFGGLADMNAQNAIDPVTNLPVSMTEFNKAQVMANLTKSGEFEAAGLLRNYQQRMPGSAEALMEFRNMRQAQQQFAQRPQQATPANPYTPPAQNKPLYVPSGQPQPPANVPQLATDASTSIGNMLSSAMPKPAPRGSGVNIDPSLWTPEAMARANPYGANSRPLPTHPNDMRGQSRGYGLAYSSGGSSSIAPAGGKVAGWSPTYSGDRQAPVAPPSVALSQNPYQAAPAQPAPFDMAAAVARNRAALDAKYPTPEIPAAGVGNVALQPTARTPLDFMQGQDANARQALINNMDQAPYQGSPKLSQNRESVRREGEFLKSEAERGALSRRSPLSIAAGNAVPTINSAIGSAVGIPMAVGSAITAPIRSGYGALGALGSLGMSKGRELAGGITGLNKPNPVLTEAEKRYRDSYARNPYLARQ